MFFGEPTAEKVYTIYYEHENRFISITIDDVITDIRISIGEL
jgi:hypothetical protein